MTQRFTRRFRVRQYELDALGRVNDVTLVRYMQEAAIEASTALGFSTDWYLQHGAIWLVRRLAVRYLAPVVYGDEVAIHTWVSGLRGVRSTRDYDLHRSGDDALVARARAEWVYMDTQTRQPTRCPEAWAEAFSKPGELHDLGVRLSNPRPVPTAHRYITQRRVQFHELDTIRHVNHAVYLQWVGEAFFDAVCAAGHSLETTDREGWLAFPAGHEIQYFAPALANDPIEITSWVCELGEHCWAWTHEVHHAQTRKLLVRDYSVRGFVGLDGSPVAAPLRTVEDVVRGPAD